MIGLLFRDERRAKTKSAITVRKAASQVLELGLPTGLQFTAETLAFTVHRPPAHRQGGDRGSPDRAQHHPHVVPPPEWRSRRRRSVLVGRSLGRRRLQEADDAVKSGLALAIAFMAVCGVAFALLEVRWQRSSRTIQRSSTTRADSSSWRRSFRSSTRSTSSCVGRCAGEGRSRGGDHRHPHRVVVPSDLRVHPGKHFGWARWVAGSASPMETVLASIFLAPLEEGLVARRLCRGDHEAVILDPARDATGAEPARCRVTSPARSSMSSRMMSAPTVVVAPSSTAVGLTSSRSDANANRTGVAPLSAMRPLHGRGPGASRSVARLDTPCRGSAAWATFPPRSPGHRRRRGPAQVGLPRRAEARGRLRRRRGRARWGSPGISTRPPAGARASLRTASRRGRTRARLLCDVMIRAPRRRR